MGYSTAPNERYEIYDTLNIDEFRNWRATQSRAPVEQAEEIQEVTPFSAGPTDLDACMTLGAITERQGEEGDDTASESNSNATPQQDHKFTGGSTTVRRKKTLFVKIKVKCLQSSTLPANEFVSELGFVIAQIKAVDPRFLLSPYPRATQTLPLPPLIHGVKRIPKRVGELRQYFPNLHPQEKGGDYYVKALIAFDKSFDSIMEQIGWDLKMNSAPIFENDLQVPDTSKAGCWIRWL
jgi:hypothetical protein